MIEHVGDLVRQRLVVLAERGDDGLDRLFAELLGDARRARRQQAFRIGRSFRGFAPRADEFCKIVQGEAHGASTPSRRIASPAFAMWRFASPMVNSPKWKIEAASTALAWPSRTPSTRWSRLPTPPEAITGIVTASATARVSSMSKPIFE